ncbi:TetR/AcrR family transcriptional regulator [Actibacterium sp. 188UL27-1]|uniref:TetR/AcrR family transcriptional regulator n=1 Tax=Actibacterium sp. 188UL27-1 TaxID=2786961 RepID=UPI00195F1490|nr:TetR/AcrR family transcriptional regulator [Actibacterium sp. 188UL27-1]MBM7068854.1 TetR/AcrR family transcriptional regulator [Actibacterium sp. 188UL27-1]
MARKTEERREELRQTLITLTEVQIRAAGVESLRARDLAKQAGCSVGAIYNVFDDLTGLAMAANIRTFQELAATIEVGLAQCGDTPTERLIAMSHAYLRFAQENEYAWRALFDIDIADGATAPDWYSAALAQLFGVIADPVQELFPNYSGEQVQLLTRALFSSVHGIVLLGLERATAGVPQEQISEMIAMVLKLISPRN